MAKLATVTKAADIALLHSDHALMSNMHGRYRLLISGEMKEENTARRHSHEHEDARTLLRLIESTHPDRSDSGLWRRSGRATMALWISQGWSLRHRKSSRPPKR